MLPEKPVNFIVIIELNRSSSFCIHCRYAIHMVRLKCQWFVRDVMKRFLLLITTWVVSPVLGSTSGNKVVIENYWRVESSVFECRLVSTIPYVGEAVFHTRAGEESAFYLNARTNRFLPGEANVTTQFPQWKEDNNRHLLGAVTVLQGRRPIRLESEWTEELLSQLYFGREIALDANIQLADDQIGMSSLVLSAIGFRPAYKHYLSCLTSLLPSNFDQIKRTALYFPAANVDEIPEDEKYKLDRIIQLVKHDRRVRSFYVDGHTDGEGNRAANLDISKTRAQLVAQYFMRRGVPGDWITVRWHGERYPVASNKTESGRAKNRRVTVRLERVEEIEVLPLASR